ncbi:ribonuclease HII [Qingshengfaniella alkalisoli]|uniref:Ribonuclease HII n=1 Tax=Qingshengfaniella alkalisoli TaxID=2599296 RepID=A0A5B8IQ44_9RHOB|nr:ribonuclease HII [Qingshengfaniella alkalisoli]QDY68372.1 ribonuclease HII [Qingshengfaniella alkalisoli]
MTVSLPDFSREALLYRHGVKRIAGVDEVGRGPLAGPVTAAAVWLDPNNIPDGLNDSKKLSPKRREALFEMLLQEADVSIAHASVAEIDEHNILRASHMAMMRALAGLKGRADYAFIDGTLKPKGLNLPADMIVKGDAKAQSIAAASIVAKVARDRIMAELDHAFPHYGWATNAGYPTVAHKLALKEHGVTPHHRRSFRPVHNILYPDTIVTS